jgi:hypothetical protein
MPYLEPVGLTSTGTGRQGARRFDFVRAEMLRIDRLGHVSHRDRHVGQGRAGP